MKDIKKRIKNLYDILNGIYTSMTPLHCDFEILKSDNEIIMVKNTDYGLRCIVLTKNSLEYKNISEGNSLFYIKCGILKTNIEGGLTEREMDLAILEFENAVEKSLVLPFTTLILGINN